MADSFDVRPIQREDLNWVAQFLDEHWGSTKIVSRGKAYYAHELPGFLALVRNKPVGMVTVRLFDDECEIMTLNSLRPGIGIGTALVETVRELAMANGCRRVWLVTTNDNLDALRFYQKRDFRLVAVHRDALDMSRRLKPEIPLIGKDGIPIHDEIELEYVLKP